MKLRAALLSLALVLPCLAQAGPAEENVTYGYAQVMRVTPVYGIFRVRVPEQRCESGPVRDGGDGTTGTVVGAIVGGALGNQVGKGDGRKASTIAGAVIGGSIGRRVDRNSPGPGPGTRCRTVDVEREDRRIVGYDVEYQYKGDKYMSRLDQDPGSRLRIRIAVTPDDPSGYR
jgi:uncharacterized protein YcfJ